MVESPKILNARYEKAPVEGNQYQNFCGFFDLLYKPAGETPCTIDLFRASECFGSLFSSTGCRIWWACHDKDTWNGQLKVAHIHFVISFKRKRYYSTAFREVCEAFGFPMRTQATKADGEFAVDDDGKPVMILNPWLTMSACVSLIGAIRYLIHADDKDKHQYTFDNIITNDIAMAKMCMFCKEGSLTSDVLIKLIWESRGNIRVLCSVMGLDYFQKYQTAIRLLVNQYRFENDGYLNKEDDAHAEEPKFTC